MNYDDIIAQPLYCLPLLHVCRRRYMSLSGMADADNLANSLEPSNVLRRI